MEDNYVAYMRRVRIRGIQKHEMVYGLVMGDAIALAVAYLNGKAVWDYGGDSFELEKFNPLIYRIDVGRLDTFGAKQAGPKTWPRLVGTSLGETLDRLFSKKYLNNDVFLKAVAEEVTEQFILGGYRSKKYGIETAAYLSSLPKPERRMKPKAEKSVAPPKLNVPFSTTITLEEPMKPESRTPIFISHASSDKALVDLFVRSFLRLGLEVPSRDIFCTTLAGMGIPSGADFRDAIKDKITDAALVFLLITPNYQQSQMCIAEMGAAWVLGKRVIPLIVPPIDYGTAGILVTPNQIIKMDVAANLDQLKVDVEAALGIKDNVHLATWGVTRDSFLKELRGILEINDTKK